jgi:hypothetical protein
MNAGFPPFSNPNPFTLYQLVVKGKYDMPKQFDPKVGVSVIGGCWSIYAHHSGNKL